MTKTNFGSAIEAVKNGAKAYREGWNGKGMSIFLNRGSVSVENVDLTESEIKETMDDKDGIITHIDGVSVNLFDAGAEDTVTRLPNLNMMSAKGNIVTGWLASQTDILAEDWEFEYPTNA